MCPLIQRNLVYTPMHPPRMSWCQQVLSSTWHLGGRPASRQAPQLRAAGRGPPSGWLGSPTRMPRRPPRRKHGRLGWRHPQPPASRQACASAGGVGADAQSEALGLRCSRWMASTAASASSSRSIWKAPMFSLSCAGEGRVGGTGRQGKVSAGAASPPSSPPPRNGALRKRGPAGPRPLPAALPASRWGAPAPWWWRR